MYELRDSGITPPCGWTYKIKETRVEVEGDDLDTLFEKVKENLDINRISYDKNILRATIEDDICRRSPSGICKGFMNWFITRPRDVMNGTTALAIMLKRGKGAFVSNSIAEERAKICVKCKYNIDNPGCITCKGFKIIINGARHGRITTLDSELNTCGICRCFLEALVHVDVDILRATTPPNRVVNYPEHCWKKKELTKGE
jgi:hypothetical protein